MELESRICKHAKIINSSGWKVILCEKKKGINPPIQFPFLSRGEICVSTEFNVKGKPLVPQSKIYFQRIKYCLHKEY